MNKQCKLCGGLAEYCGKNIYGKDVYKCTFCHALGHLSRFEKVTLFTKITESPEMLAEKVVYRDRLGFSSPFIQEMFYIDVEEGKNHTEKYFKAKNKAIAATLAKLNESIDYE